MGCEWQVCMGLHKRWWVRWCRLVAPVNGGSAKWLCQLEWSGGGAGGAVSWTRESTPATPWGSGAGGGLLTHYQTDHAGTTTTTRKGEQHTTQ